MTRSFAAGRLAARRPYSIKYAPNVGVRMCGGYDNRATIVAPSSRVLDTLGGDVGGVDRIIVYS